jgi:hypothetical protein
MTEILWTSPPPTWQQAENVFGQPALLRFASDKFMEEFLALLQNQPERLPELRARPETWQRPQDAVAPVKTLSAPLRALQLRRGGMLGALAANTLAAISPEIAPEDLPFKLYQPAHMRYYLITACLVCRQVGMPDRAMDTGAQEKASFVVRRLMLKNPNAAGKKPTPTEEPGKFDEYAFVDKTWQPVSDGESLTPGEQQHPLFAVNYQQADGYRRRVFSGLVPTGQRDVYLGVNTLPATLPTTNTATPDKRLEMQARRVFFAPWQQLIEIHNDVVNRCIKDLSLNTTGENKAAQAALLKQTRLKIQESSWYLLLDFADFLAEHLPGVQTALEGGSAAGLGTQQGNLLQALKDTRLPSAVSEALKHEFGPQPLGSLADALGKIRPFRTKLEGAKTAYGQPVTGPLQLGVLWPDFLFPLVDVATTDDSQAPVPALSIAEPAPFASSMESFLASLETLLQKVLLAIPTPVGRLPAVPLASQLAAQTPARVNETGWFVIRCVFERPNCLPEPTAILSQPTEAFQIAGFFDPDAPARPIRIDLPFDTSPAGLRKFDKNTAFVVSDMLCGQVKRARGLGLGDLIRSVLPFPLHKDLDASNAPCEEGGVNIGMICSLSIPIITICAFIMLMVIVLLLDFIFRWMTFFIMCFPLPKFSAKESP